VARGHEVNHTTRRTYAQTMAHATKAFGTKNVHASVACRHRHALGTSVHYTLLRLSDQAPVRKQEPAQ
jgi:hypothetical protein